MSFLKCLWHYFLVFQWLWAIPDGKPSQECSFKAGFSQGMICGPSFLMLNIIDVPDDDICDIGIYADDAALSQMIFGNSLSWQLKVNLTCQTLA